MRFLIWGLSVFLSVNGLVFAPAFASGAGAGDHHYIRDDLDYIEMKSKASKDPKVKRTSQAVLETAKRLSKREEFSISGKAFVNRSDRAKANARRKNASKLTYQAKKFQKQVDAFQEAVAPEVKQEAEKKAKQEAEKKAARAAAANYRYTHTRYTTQLGVPGASELLVRNPEDLIKKMERLALESKDSGMQLLVAGWASTVRRLKTELSQRVKDIEEYKAKKAEITASNDPGVAKKIAKLDASLLEKSQNSILEIDRLNQQRIGLEKSIKKEMPVAARTEQAPAQSAASSAVSAGSVAPAGVGSSFTPPSMTPILRAAAYSCASSASSPANAVVSSSRASSSALSPSAAPNTRPWDDFDAAKGTIEELEQIEKDIEDTEKGWKEYSDGLLSIVSAMKFQVFERDAAVENRKDAIKSIENLKEARLARNSEVRLSSSSPSVFAPRPANPAASLAKAPQPVSQDPVVIKPKKSWGSWFMGGLRKFFSFSWIWKKKAQV